MKKRLHWIDVAKCFGIFSIYLGHCGINAGDAYQFVFKFHVPLFFLLSGCMEANTEAQPLHRVAIKIVKQILIPWLICCIISIVAYVLTFNGNIGNIKYFVLIIAKGTVRNTFIAGGLWFLPCLAVMKAIFAVVRKVKNKVCMLLLCGGMFWITQYVFKHNPVAQPSWIFNVDSALYYIFYYAIGFVSFPYLCRMLESGTTVGRVFLLLSGAAAFCYSALLFFGKNVLSFIYAIPYIGAFGAVITALIVIWLLFLVARLCQNVITFRNIGQNTLYLCGGEYTAMLVFHRIIAMLGLSVNMASPTMTICYVVALLLFANRFFVPVAKQIVNTVLTIPQYLKAK